MKRYILIEDTFDSEGVLLRYEILSTSLSLRRLDTKAQKRAVRLRFSCDNIEGRGIAFSDDTSRTIEMIGTNNRTIYKAIRILKK